VQPVLFWFLAWCMHSHTGQGRHPIQAVMSLIPTRNCRLTHDPHATSHRQTFFLVGRHAMDPPPVCRRAINDVTKRRSEQMMGESLAGIQQFLILIWYFIIDRPAVETVMEEKLGSRPETQAQRMQRRWERSRARAGRKG
jgi:hypothetical protein